MALLLLRTPTTLAAMGCILFALHPVHSEVVASLVGRSDLLATLLFLLSSLLLLSAKPLSLLRSTLIVLTGVAAILCKESVAFIFLILPLWLRTQQAPTHHQGRRGEELRRLMVMGFFGLTAYLLLRHGVLSEAGVLMTARNQFGNDWLAQRWTALSFVFYFFEKLFSPLPLLPDYAVGIFRIGSTEQVVRSLSAAISLLALLFVVAWQWRRHRTCTPLLTGMAGFLLGLAPVCNLLIIIGTPFAERLLYFPMALLLVCLAQTGWQTAWKQLSVQVRRIMTGFAMCVLVMLFSICWIRASTWRDNVSLVSSMMLDFPEIPEVRRMYLQALDEAGLLKER
jgi:hypothetical protein